jgi:hypothetical protein
MVPRTNALRLSFRSLAARAASRSARDESGSAIVEFALIAPMFFFLMFVIAETALVFIAEQVLDNAVFESARLIRTGQAQNWEPSPLTKATFKLEVCNRVSVFIDCGSTDFYLDVRSFDTFGGLEFGKPVDEEDEYEDEGQYIAGGPESIVVVRAYYQWPTNKIFGALSLQNLNNGKRLIGSFAAFRNEPYTGTN